MDIDYLPVVQSVPSHADVQAHSTATLSRAVQEPEFWHGVAEQGPGARDRKKATIDH